MQKKEKFGNAAVNAEERKREFSGYWLSIEGSMESKFS